MRESPPIVFAISAVLKGLVCTVVVAAVLGIFARVVSSDLAGDGASAIVGVGVWLVSIMVGVQATRRTWKARASLWRKLNGRCVECGYDLRSSESRCPECGTAIEMPISSRLDGRG